MTNGFLRVAAAVPKVRVADTTANTQEIENLMVAADGKKIDILCFPELSITAYTCQDLFSQQLLLEEAEHALMKILELSRNLQVTTLVGLPFYHRGMLLNCAAVVHNGKLHGLVPKTYIPNYKEFYERRWFTSATDLHENETHTFFADNLCLWDQSSCSSIKTRLSALRSAKTFGRPSRQAIAQCWKVQN